VGGGGGVESSFSEKLLSSKQAFQYQNIIIHHPFNYLLLLL
jgi:hypothetical protein